MGFSQVRILGINHLQQDERLDQFSIARTVNVSRVDTALKAQWHRIEIYINENKILQEFPDNPLRQAQLLNQEITSAIRKQSVKNFSSFSGKEFLYYDIVPLEILIITALFIIDKRE